MDQNCTDPSNSLALNTSLNVNNIPEEYFVNQSTIQAFYLIKNIMIDNTIVEEGDFLLAYNNNILVGSTKIENGMTIIPVMGRDLSEQTEGYLEIGEKPELKLLRYNTGEEIILNSDLDGFDNLLVSDIELITGSTMIIPDNFTLQPAYPNPFNPMTTITFGIPEIMDQNNYSSTLSEPIVVHIAKIDSLSYFQLNYLRNLSLIFMF